MEEVKRRKKRKSGILDKKFIIQKKKKITYLITDDELKDIYEQDEDGQPMKVGGLS